MTSIIALALTAWALFFFVDKYDDLYEKHAERLALSFWNDLFAKLTKYFGGLVILWYTNTYDNVQVAWEFVCSLFA